MGATGQRRLSSLPAAAAAAPLLLLLAVSSWSQAAASAAAAPAWTTDLEKHVAFFDTDNDGIVTFSETEQGLRAIGLGVLEATASATLINGVIGPKTRPENATTSRFDIYIANIHKGMHGSDSGSYDAQGRFVPAKFNGIFTRFAKVEPNALNEAELEAMRTANRKEGDFKGWAASKAEWGMLYNLAKDKDGFLEKNTARTVYDGSLFPKLVKKASSSGN
ncbi:putative peroxygenase 4 [Hordeum vulgare]|uniref:EF-hand domain-containing protein n=1 Tax=Hordeum vulgare subsp. vulgare TaxID=112509 RepID=A0A8I7BHE5_HORVV|nr:probable peroxygenase 5 [Hordeum vulgare subsp. vulgare]KAE8775738.1 putative peroxygenase 4 [Hordeum vulgare]